MSTGGPHSCASFRERMLEADPPELRGQGDSPLALHVRTCRSCARVASLLLEQTARLDAYLTAARPPDVDAILARAGVPLAGKPARAPGPRFAPRMRRLPRRYLWVPVAAAAALAALLLLRAPGGHVATTSVATAAQPAPPPVVEPPAGQNAAVLQTDDPNITVVWLFPTG